MKAWEIVAYTYDADIFCPNCAEEKFGQQLDSELDPPVDSEGNDVHPVFASDTDDYQNYCCGKCGCKLAE